MRKLFSAADLQALSVVMAVALLLSTIPLTSGVVIVFGPAQPELTINICHPLQTFEGTSNTILARPAATGLGFGLPDFGFISLKPSTQPNDRNVAPDTPPPKHLV